MRPVGLLLGLAPTMLTLLVGGWRQHQWRQSYDDALASPVDQRQGMLKQAVERAGSPFVAPAHLIESLLAQAQSRERSGAVAAARDALLMAVGVRSPLFPADAPRALALRDLARLDHLVRDRDAEVAHRSALLNALDPRLQPDRLTLARDTFDLAEAVAAQGRSPELASTLYEQAHALWHQKPSSDQAVLATLGQARLALTRADLHKADHLFAEAVAEGLEGAGDAPARCDAVRQALLVKRLLGRDAAETASLRAKHGQDCFDGVRVDTLAGAQALIAGQREALRRGEPVTTGRLTQAELALLALADEGSTPSEKLADAWYELARVYAAGNLDTEAMVAVGEALSRPGASPPPWHSEALRLRGNSRLRAQGQAGASQAVSDLRAAREDYLDSGPTSGFLDLSLELAEAELKASDRAGSAQTLAEVAPPIRAGNNPQRAMHLEALLRQAGVTPPR